MDAYLQIAAHGGSAIDYARDWEVLAVVRPFAIEKAFTHWNFVRETGSKVGSLASSSWGAL